MCVCAGARSDRTWAGATSKASSSRTAFATLGPSPPPSRNRLRRRLSRASCPRPRRGRGRQPPCGGGGGGGRLPVRGALAAGSWGTSALSPSLPLLSACLFIATPSVSLSLPCSVPRCPVLSPCRLRALPRCFLFSTRRVRTLALDPCFLPLSRPFSPSSACRIRLALDATLSTSDLHFLRETKCRGIDVSSPTAAYRRGQRQHSCLNFPA